ncbi:hypothetical protein BCR44DRAFT_34153 [Catenaria anguillulae PL171]|uniref:Uncharacterized protein n=1 Tax=Catenaria anguillulae PL171 TaxID=765915 RepID=A0A1Y2HUT0_9FUNG|nr:hypothetical protein BCR44DRAFT_34153 [Catenaria anguillulae PL171]
MSLAPCLRPKLDLSTLSRTVVRAAQHRAKSTKSTSAARHANVRRPPSIIIPPTFHDGKVPKAQLRLTPEEATARAKRLADPAIIDKLRAEGRMLPAHWRFNHDPVRATDKEIERGWSTLDAYKKTSIKYWMSLPGQWRGWWDGLRLSRMAFETGEMKEFLSPYGGMLNVVVDTVKPALEGLSYSPKNHAKFTSATTRGLYTPTMFARLSECTNVMRKQGDLRFDLTISKVRGFTAINQLVLFGEHSTITTVDLLGPRIVLPTLGGTQQVAYLEYDVDSVPIWQQSAYFRDSHGNMSLQFLIDVEAHVSGTATIERVPGVSKGKRASPPAAAAIGIGSVVEAKEDRVVFQESFEERRIVIRMASNPFLFDRETGDLNINLRSTWRVADIDYLTSKPLIERGRKLALCMSKMERT